MTALDGSWMKAIFPSAPISIVAAITVPPAASAFLTVGAASAVPDGHRPGGSCLRHFH